MIKTRQEQEADPVWIWVDDICKKKIHGGLNNRESLVYVVSKLGFSTVGVEVGVDTGNLSQVILTYMKPNKLYLIDPWLLYPDYIEELKGVKIGRGYNDPKYYEQKRYDGLYEDVVKRFKDNPVVQVMRGMSEDRAKDIPDDSLDWAYMDGSHREKYVYKDLVAWWSKIKIGGILCGHDFVLQVDPPKPPEVPIALEKFSKEMGLIVWPFGSDWWINKGESLYQTRLENK